MPKLQLTTPEGESLELELSAERARIGRAEDNDLVVPHASVSSYHGEITLTDSGIHIHDRGSTNGTHVDGQRVEEADIAWGSSFTLGNCKAVLVGDGGEPAPAEEPVEESHDEPESYSAPAASAPVSAGGGTVITGLGATPCPSSMRVGFGPKTKEKDSARSMLMLLGTVALVACAAAAFMIMNMSA